MELLLELTGYGWILDVVCLVILVLGLVIGCVRGFVKGICKLGGTLLAIVLAFSLCTPLQSFLESTWGFTTLIANGVKNATIAGWISVAICFVGLFIVTKFVAWLVGKLAKALVNSSRVFAVIDRLLGGILGLAEAALVILIILTILHWINVDVINSFIEQTIVVKQIFHSGWFLQATMLPGKLIGG